MDDNRQYFQDEDAYYSALDEHERGECHGLSCPWCFSEQDKKDYEDDHI